MTTQDWSDILKFVEFKVYAYKQVIVDIGTDHDCLFQVERGRIREERYFVFLMSNFLFSIDFDFLQFFFFFFYYRQLENGTIQIKRFYTVGNLFGQNGFLETGSSQTRFVVDSPFARVSILSGKSSIFQVNTLAQRFFKYLCVQIAHRLHSNNE